MNKILPFFIAITLIIGLSVDTQAQGKGKGKSKVKHAPAAKAKQGPAKANPAKKGPPAWAPAHGYRARHVYFPHHECYYDNTAGVYISLSGGKWVTSVKLPSILIGVDLKVATKVEIEYTGSTPQVNINTHRKKHPKAKAKMKMHK